MQFYTTTAFSSKQKITPEGFLLCEDVPIARTGEMVYGAGEVPIMPDAYGRIIIERDEKDVFSAETIASFQGKDVVDDHPFDGDVTPENYRMISKGVALNVRRGSGQLADHLLADLLIKDRDMITAIRAGKREVSPGYDADYEEIEPGRGRQKKIIGNHIAVVERGRCGHSCAIGDKENDKMTRTVDHSTGDRVGAFFDRLRRAFDGKDKKAFDEATEEFKHEMEDNAMTGVHLHLGHSAEHHSQHHPGHTRMGDEHEPPDWHRKFAEDCAKRFRDIHEMFGKVMHHHDSKAKDEKEEEEEEKKRKESEDAENREIEGKIKAEAPPGTGDKAAKARDSALLADTFQDTVALAEILAPGISVPTFDAALAPVKTVDAICYLRRTALDLAYTKPETRAIIDRVLGGKTIDFRSNDATCDQIRGIFIAAANVKRESNSAGMRVNNGIVTSRQRAAAAGFVGATPADINRMNEALWKKTA